MLSDEGEPILIDFSLAKVLTEEEMLTEATHTGNVGENVNVNMVVSHGFDKRKYN